MKILYKNPISGNYNFLRTHCVHCGKHFWMTKKHIGQNRYGNNYYYCKKC